MISQPLSFETETVCCDLKSAVARHNVHNAFSLALIHRHNMPGPIKFRAVKALRLVGVDFHFSFQGGGPFSKMFGHKLFNAVVIKHSPPHFFTGTRYCRTPNMFSKMFLHGLPCPPARPTALNTVRRCAGCTTMKAFLVNFVNQPTFT